MTPKNPNEPFSIAAINAMRNLFWNSNLKVYAILDRARDNLIGELVAAASCRHQSLYGGKLAERLEEFGPVLVELQEDHPFTHTIATKGEGQAWGILVLSRFEFDSVRNLLRRLLGVEMPDGGKALFRFYDPRVLRTFLPTCQKEEREMFFGNIIHSYFIESPEKDSQMEFTQSGTMTLHPPIRYLFDIRTSEDHSVSP